MPPIPRLTTALSQTSPTDFQRLIERIVYQDLPITEAMTNGLIDEKLKKPNLLALGAFLESVIVDVEPHGALHKFAKTFGASQSGTQFTSYNLDKLLDLLKEFNSKYNLGIDDKISNMRKAKEVKTFSDSEELTTQSRKSLALELKEVIERVNDVIMGRDFASGAFAGASGSVAGAGASGSDVVRRRVEKSHPLEESVKAFLNLFGYHLKRESLSQDRKGEVEYVVEKGHILLAMASLESQIQDPSARGLYNGKIIGQFTESMKKRSPQEQARYLVSFFQFASSVEEYGREFGFENSFLVGRSKAFNLGFVEVQGIFASFPDVISNLNQDQLSSIRSSFQKLGIASQIDRNGKLNLVGEVSVVHQDLNADMYLKVKQRKNVVADDKIATRVLQGSNTLQDVLGELYRSIYAYSKQEQKPSPQGRLTLPATPPLDTLAQAQPVLRRREEERRGLYDTADTHSSKGGRMGPGRRAHLAAVAAAASFFSGSGAAAGASHPYPLPLTPIQKIEREILTNLISIITDQSFGKGSIKHSGIEVSKARLNSTPCYRFSYGEGKEFYVYKDKDQLLFFIPEIQKENPTWIGVQQISELSRGEELLKQIAKNIENIAKSVEAAASVPSRAPSAPDAERLNKGATSLSIITRYVRELQAARNPQDGIDSNGFGYGMGIRFSDPRLQCRYNDNSETQQIEVSIRMPRQQTGLESPKILVLYFDKSQLLDDDQGMPILDYSKITSLKVSTTSREEPEKNISVPEFNQAMRQQKGIDGKLSIEDMNGILRLGVNIVKQEEGISIA